MPELPEFLTPEQVAEYLQISVEEVIDLLSRGQMPGSQVGGGKWRIRKSKLDDWMDSLSKATTPRSNNKETFPKPSKPKPQPKSPLPKPEQAPPFPDVKVPVKVKGIVKTFNPKKGSGFILSEDGKQVYVHSRDVETWGQPLKESDRVEFEVISVSIGTGWTAKAVTILSTEPVPNSSSSLDSQTPNKLSSSESGRLYKEALAAREQGETDKAKELFEEAIRSEPHQAAFLAYAAFEKGLKHESKALQIFKKGINALPEAGMLYEHCAMLLRQQAKSQKSVESQQAKLQEAVAILRKGLEQAPNFAGQLHRALAVVLVDMDDDDSFNEAATHAEQARQLGISMQTVQTDIRLKLEFVTGNPLGRRVWEFFKSADFEVRVDKCTPEYADILLNTKHIEYTESYNLNGWILARCFFRKLKLKDTENILNTLRQPPEDYRNLDFNNGISFLILSEDSELLHNLRRSKEDNLEVIVPINQDILCRVEEVNAALRQRLDEWLSGRDLFEDRHPVSGLKFYGRETELQTLMRNIDDGHHTGIYGLRKVGKTSLMQKLPEKRPLDLVVYIDLQQIINSSCAELYWRIACELQKAIDNKKKLRLITKNVKLDLGSKTDYPKLDNPEEKNATRFDADLRKLLDVLETSEGTASSKIVIAIDELEWMLPTSGSSDGFRGYEQFFRYLRGISQNTRGKVISIVAAANPAISEQPVWNGRDNPVFQFYRDMFLPLLEKQECDDMLIKIGRGMSVAFDEQSLEAIYNEAGGHPFITRQLCSHIINRNPSRPLQISRDLVTESVETFILTKGSIFEDITERLRINFPRELELLLAIAKGSSRKVELASLVDIPIDAALKHLIGYQIVSCSENKYNIKIKLLYRWLRYSYSL